MLVISYPQLAAMLLIAWFTGITPQDLVDALPYVSGLAIFVSVAFYAVDFRWGKVRFQCSIDNKYDLLWAVFFWSTLLGWAQGISVLAVAKLILEMVARLF